MSKTYKEQEDRMSLSKNHGNKVRYLKRLQQEQEALRQQKDAMQRQQFDVEHGYGRTDYEDQ